MTLPDEEHNDGQQADDQQEGAAAALRRAARGESLTASGLLSAIGGALGLVESILPSLVFLVVYQITRALVPSVLAPLAVAAVFVVVRAIRRQKPTSAIAGAAAAALSAVLALITGNPSNAFLPGIITNAAYGVVLLASVVVGWPLIGVLVSFLVKEASAWRADPKQRRFFTWLTLLWVALFAVRLIVEVPLYLARGASSATGATSALAIARLVTGVPLYAPVLVVTVLAVQAVYRGRPAPDVS